jgi:predicted alpha/beta-fold hydrolase
MLAADTQLTIVPHGGHCGFIRDLSLRSWAEDFLVARMERVIDHPRFSDPAREA